MADYCMDWEKRHKEQQEQRKDLDFQQRILQAMAWWVD
jgi:hypothetical protein